MLRQTALSDRLVVTSRRAEIAPQAKNALGVRRKTGVRAWLKSSTRIVGALFGPHHVQIPSLEVQSGAYAIFFLYENNACVSSQFAIVR